jgi:hypothetical protein
MSDIVTKIDLADKNGVLLHTEKKYCRRNILVIPRLKPLEISENGTYPVPQGCAGHGQVSVNVVPKKETSLVITGNGTYTAPPGTVYTSIVVNVPTSSGGTPGGGEGETPHVHKYTSEVIAPSCTMGGFTLHTCACGESYQSDEKDPLGHRYVNGVCDRCGAADPNYNPSNPDVNAGEYHIIVGDTFSISYDGSSPTVECPSCLTYYDDGGELVYTAVAAGSGIIYIRVSDTLIAQYTVTVAAVATYDYNLKVGDGFEVMYEGSSPTVECPACLTYYIDGGVLIFTAAKVGTGTLWLYMSDTLIAKYTIQVAAKESGGDDTHIHSYTATVISPTCTVAGYTQHNCACGNSYRTDEVDPNGHDWRTGWQQVTAATCTASGKDKRVCFTCGHEETRTVTALGHKWSDNIVEWGNGFAYECERCGAYNPILNETCDHSSAEVIEHVAPTCTKDGYTTYECSMCGHKWTEDSSKLGHNPDKPRLTNTPTCEECAHFKVVCTRCGFLIDEYDDDGVFGEHDWCDPIVVEPTCTKAGYTRVVCNECGTITDTPGDAARGHDYQLVSDSSMSSGAAMRCTRCGDSYEADYDCSALGHETRDGEYDMPDGSTAFKCKHCGEYYPTN